MNDDKNIGYERILTYLKECQKECPKGVSLKITGSKKRYVHIRMMLGSKEKVLGCGCDLTIQGITDALAKARKVAEALKVISSETEFIAWYDKNILEKNVIKNDLMTFGEAIAKVEQTYWEGTSKKRDKRDRSNPSNQLTWKTVYGRFYALLDSTKLFSVSDLLNALNTKEKGSKVYGDCLFALKKLAATANNKEAVEALDSISHNQTKFRALQNADLEEFLAWMKDCIDGANKRYYHHRKRWLWVFSMQLIYGFRVHEVFAIQNINKPFKTKDGVVIPALNELSNKKMIAVVGEVTEMGTTTKTGYRLSAPMLPPSHPNLIEELDIRSGTLPSVSAKSSNCEAVVGRYSRAAGTILVRWKAPITQTHALRHLCNKNGKIAGIDAEDRAANLGHSLQMSTTTYMKPEATNTRLQTMENMTKRQLPLDGAIQALKRIGTTAEAIAIVAEIYCISVQDVLDRLKL